MTADKLHVRKENSSVREIREKKIIRGENVRRCGRLEEKDNQGRERMRRNRARDRGMFATVLYGITRGDLRSVYGGPSVDATATLRVMGPF